MSTITRLVQSNVYGLGFGNHLQRIDRNGTKYIRTICRCGKCNGNGIISEYIPVNGGVCFDCNGTGIMDYVWKEYTEEYLEKRNARREAKLKKARLEAMAAFENGKIYIVLGETFSQKEELKKAGAKFNPVHKWYFQTENENFRTQAFPLEEAFEVNSDGTVDFDFPKTVKIADPETVQSQYIAEVGEKVEQEVTLLHSVGFSRLSYNGFTYETYWTHCFVTPEGNKLVWKTTAVPCNPETGNPFKDGDKFTIKATVKNHGEYKGEKQTVLNRVRVTKTLCE